MNLRERIQAELKKQGVPLKNTGKSSLDRVSAHFRKTLTDLIPDTFSGIELKNRLFGFGHVGRSCAVRNGFRFHYGSNIYLMDSVFINYNCLFLDSDLIFIASNVNIGPCVNIYTIDHKPTEEGLTSVRSPVYIEEGVWIGGNSTILPGVTIGQGSIIGAGSVVTRPVEPCSLYAGAPARKIKYLGRHTNIYNPGGNNRYHGG
ncbi:MAG: sugar O-acetyltransferase [Nanoarchaeota archaeon]|nr:sugar O-acetyltransferase [Nanoarchaeota archaeon]